MTWGTFVVGSVLCAIVTAIIVYLIRNARAGRHVGCSSCNACSKADGSIRQGGCACADLMVEAMDAQLGSQH